MTQKLMYWLGVSSLVVPGPQFSVESVLCFTFTGRNIFAEVCYLTVYKVKLALVLNKYRALYRDGGVEVHLHCLIPRR